MLDGAIIIPLQGMLWGLLFEVAALIWLLDRALLLLAYFTMAVTAWITDQVFTPLLQVVGDQTGILVGPIFVIAITVLGFTYLMAVFGRFEVVSLRSAVLWLLFAAALYTFGPNLYLGMESFRRDIGGVFYEFGVQAFNDAGAVQGLGAVGTTPQDAVPIPTDQLGAFLPLSSVTPVDGVDVALVYLDADGADLLGAAGGHPLGRLPWNMIGAELGGYFDPATGPDVFSSLSEAQRQESISSALQGIARLLTGFVIALFAVVEQLVHFLMAASFAAAFFSMFIATLFGFFIRTEPIAWGSLQLIIELFLQTILNSFLMSLILGFVLAGANSGNAILLLGGGIAGLWMAWNLLQGALKALMGAAERLFKSFAAATGGNFATVGETNTSIGQAGALAGTAALGAMTGAAVLAGGGSLLQAAGATFGDNRTAQTMSYASRMLGGESTLLGGAAEQFGEGAAARGIAGPVGGYLLGGQTSRQREDSREQQARENYRGADDLRRDAAVNDFDPDGESDSPFTPGQAARVEALSRVYDPDDFDAAVQTVRRIRNTQPDLEPSSPAFQREVRRNLPANLQGMDADALSDFSTIFGAPADSTPSPYMQALAASLPSVPPPLADDARDNAVADYRETGQMSALTDAFSPDDANRVAQLMDAYDDDDFATLVDAVRTNRDANPDQTPGSQQALQATRRLLPPNLRQMPSADLNAASLAFGGSAVPPAVRPSSSIVGALDADRDASLAAFRLSDDPSTFDEGFSAADATDITLLSDRYRRDDFDSVVAAVRQVRTADPDLEAGSTAALRATRRQLPAALQQMPSNDLAAFSRVFGASADRPTVASPVRASRNSGGRDSAVTGGRSSVSEPSFASDPFADVPPPDFVPEDDISASMAALERLRNYDISLDDDLPTLAPPDTVNIPAPAFRAEARRQAETPTALSDATPVNTPTILPDDPPPPIDLPRQPVQFTPARMIQPLRRNPIPSTPPSPAAIPFPAEQPPNVGTPIPRMRQLGQARRDRLETMGITTAEQLQAAEPAAISSALRVSPTQVMSWQAEVTPMGEFTPSTAPNPIPVAVMEELPLVTSSAPIQPSTVALNVLASFGNESVPAIPPAVNRSPNPAPAPVQSPTIAPPVPANAYSPVQPVTPAVNRPANPAPVLAQPSTVVPNAPAGFSPAPVPPASPVGNSSASPASASMQPPIVAPNVPASFSPAPAQPATPAANRPANQASASIQSPSVAPTVPANFVAAPVQSAPPTVNSVPSPVQPSTVAPNVPASFAATPVPSAPPVGNRPASQPTVSVQPPTVTPTVQANFVAAPVQSAPPEENRSTPVQPSSVAPNVPASFSPAPVQSTPSVGNRPSPVQPPSVAPTLPANFSPAPVQSTPSVGNRPSPVQPSSVAPTLPANFSPAPVQSTPSVGNRPSPVQPPSVAPTVPANFVAVPVQSVPSGGNRPPIPIQPPSVTPNVPANFSPAPVQPAAPAVSRPANPAPTPVRSAPVAPNVPANTATPIQSAPPTVNRAPAPIQPPPVALNVPANAATPVQSAPQAPAENPLTASPLDGSSAQARAE